jgi:hypothetical protein
MRQPTRGAPSPKGRRWSVGHLGRSTPQILRGVTAWGWLEVEAPPPHPFTLYKERPLSLIHPLGFCLLALSLPHV